MIRHPVPVKLQWLGRGLSLQLTVSKVGLKYQIAPINGPTQSAHSKIWPQSVGLPFTDVSIALPATQWDNIIIPPG